MCARGMKKRLIRRASTLLVYNVRNDRIKKGKKKKYNNKNKKHVYGRAAALCNINQVYLCI